MYKRIAILIMTLAVIFASVSLAISSVDKNSYQELYRQVQLFADTLAIVQADYVNEPKPKDLIYGALKGMLVSLDPYSQFMDPDMFNELKVDTQGKFGGIGVEITIRDSLLTIITPIEDTPAWRAGLKSGDIIVKIKGELTRDLALTEAVKRMRGKPGEEINLSILRESVKKILEFKIVRAIIKIKDIKEAKILKNGVAYIRLIEFRENTAANMNSTLERLSKMGMKALILDLRNNPGGLLESSVKITSKFIPKGKLIVYTKGRKTTQDTEFISDVSNPLTTLPMVVLINEGSASGSEIVAGALQDYKRATIIGTKSFGKGSIQTVIPLSDGSALRLTTSKYFTPLGKEIHEKGVTPDIIVEIETKTDRDQKILEENGFKEQLFKEPAIFDYRSDTQVLRALEILKIPELSQGSFAK